MTRKQEVIGRKALTSKKRKKVFNPFKHSIKGRKTFDEKCEKYLQYLLNVTSLSTYRRWEIKSRYVVYWPWSLRQKFYWKLLIIARNQFLSDWRKEEYKVEEDDENQKYTYWSLYKNLLSLLKEDEKI